MGRGERIMIKLNRTDISILIKLIGDEISYNSIYANKDVNAKSVYADILYDLQNRLMGYDENED